MLPIDPARSALLVVDAQRGFTDLQPAELPVPGGTAVVGPINASPMIEWETGRGR